MFKSHKFINGQTIYILLMFVFLILLWIGVNSLGWQKTWKKMIGDSMYPAFSDWQCIAGATQGWEEGLDVYTNNPYDPEKRRLNYPLIWLPICSTLGLTLDNAATVGAGILVATVLFSSLVLINTPAWMGILAVLFILSPAVILGWERGNCDLIVFNLICLALYLQYRSKNIASGLSVLLAAFLKLFPLASIGMYIQKDWKKSVKIILPILILFALYLFLTKESLGKLLFVNATGYNESDGSSYGGMVFFKHFMEKRLLFPEDFKWIYRGCILLAATFTLFLCSLLKNFQKDSWFKLDNEYAANAFLAGMGIFLGTFVVGFNFDYRFIFLFLTIPQFVLWMKSGHWSCRLYSLLCFILLIASIWWLKFYPKHLSDKYAVIIDRYIPWPMFIAYLFLYWRTIQQRLGLV